MPKTGVGYTRKKSTSPYWFACFPSPDGSRWLQRSTKTTDKALATRLMLEWESASRLGITESQAFKVLSEIHEAIHGKALKSSTPREYATRWLADKKGETSPGTYRVYEHVVRDFIRHLQTRADSALSFLSDTDVKAYRAATATRSSKSTANKYLRVIGTFLNDAWRAKLVSENPAAKVKRLKSVEKRRRPFTLVEIKAMLSVADTEWRGMILFGLYTGQRLGDIVRLTWAQVDLAKNEVRFLTEKTDRDGTIPLAKGLADYLTELPTGDDARAPVFPRSHELLERTGLVGNISNRFADLLAVAGLAPKRTHAKKNDGKGRDSARQASGLSFHCFRHTCTTLLKTAGVPQAVVMDFVGHDSAAVSANYTHIDDEAKRAAVAKLPTF